MRWVVVLAMLAGCNPPLSDRQYCVKRQMAWESAFPTPIQTDAQRDQFVERCLSTIAAKHASGEFDRSVRCFDQLVRGKGHAKEEYLAFETCERGSAAP